MKYCSKCEMEFKDEMEYCSRCGEKLIERYNKCPFCGEEIADPVNDFCVVCGKRLYNQVREDYDKKLENPVKLKGRKINFQKLGIGLFVIIVLGSLIFNFPVVFYNLMVFKYQVAARSGAPEAIFDLGYYMLNHNPTGDGYSEGLNIIEQAANKDYYKAEEYLGYLYDNGKFVWFDREVALKWYRKAAEHGSATAKTKAEVIAKDIDEREREYSEKLNRAIEDAKVGNLAHKVELIETLEKGGLYYLRRDGKFFEMRQDLNEALKWSKYFEERGYLPKGSHSKRIENKLGSQ